MSSRWTLKDLADLDKRRGENNLKQIFKQGKVYETDVPFTKDSVLPKPKQNKYRNKKVVTEKDGTFDSKKEYNRWLELKQMECEEKIFQLGRQREFLLDVNGYEICKYKSDFDYWTDGKQIVEDVKSAMTKKLPVYRLKRKLMKAIWNIEILET